MTLRMIRHLTFLLCSVTVAAQAAETHLSHTEILRQLAPIAGQAQRSVDLSISFDFGSARLSKAAHKQLDALGAALTDPKLAEARIGIYGHTDAVGDAKANMQLSIKRAASVSAYLVKKFHIDKKRLEAAGFGETKLKNPMAPEAAENRRVQVKYLGKLSPATSQKARDASKGQLDIRW